MPADNIGSDTDYKINGIFALLKNDYRVYVPIINSDRIAISKDDKFAYECIIRPAWSDKKGFVTTLTDVADEYLIVLHDPPYTTWLIPYNDIDMYKTIRLGKQRECYIVGKSVSRVSLNMPKSAIKSSVKKAAELFAAQHNKKKQE